MKNRKHVQDANKGKRLNKNQVSEGSNHRRGPGINANGVRMGNQGVSPKERKRRTGKAMGRKRRAGC